MSAVALPDSAGLQDAALQQWICNRLGSANPANCYRQSQRASHDAGEAHSFSDHRVAPPVRRLSGFSPRVTHCYRPTRRKALGERFSATAALITPRHEELLELCEAARPSRQPTPAAVAEAAPSLSTESAPVVRLTALIGREVEVAEVCSLLNPASTRVRLLTLLGPGGVGKTRLAMAVSDSVGHSYHHGAAVVDLAPLRDHRLVPATIARALGLRQAGGRSARELLVDFLHQRQVLLVLDNMEHLTPAAPLLVQLLEASPRLTVLVTSRTALRLQVEHRFTVSPLLTPAVDAQLEAEVIAAAPAVQLFVKGAQAVLPGFALGDANASAVAGVCRRLDGLPLAIELAAARVPLLSPVSLLRRLERRLPVLTGGPQDLPDRQQTLRKTLIWSHDLLGPKERLLFRRLAVFAGGGMLDAIEAVCVDAELPLDALLDRLQALIDSSLLRRLDTDADEPRFGMLETMREFAAELLAASGEEDIIMRRQRDWCCALVSRRAPEWVDQHQVAALDFEQDNLRSALRWTIQHGEIAAGLQLGIGSWPLWYTRGRYAEGRPWFAKLVAAAKSGDNDVAALLGRALAYAGHLAYCEGHMPTAEALLHQALASAESVSDAVGTDIAVQLLGNVARARGAFVEAEALYRRALSLSRQTGSRAWEIMQLVQLAMVRFERDDASAAAALVREALALCEIQDHPTARARALALSARLASLVGENDVAEAQFEESLNVLRQVGDQQGLAYAHLLAGHAAMGGAVYSEAAVHFEAVLAIARDTHEHLALARGLEGVARLLSESQPATALRLVGAAERLRQTLGLELAPLDQIRLEEWLARTRGRVGQAAESLLAAGRLIPVAEAAWQALAACAELS